MPRQGCRQKKAVPKTRSQEAKNPKINGETLGAAVTWILKGVSFPNLKLHGNTGWLVCDLIILAVLWVWSEDKTLTGAFTKAHGLSVKLLGHAAVSIYQGLTGALITHTAALLPVLCERMHDLMERHGGEHWRIGGWLPLAVDGSRIGVPSGSAANGSQRGGILREELWQQRECEDSREETSEEGSTETEEKVAAGQTADLVDCCLAHESAIALVLANGSIELQRTGPFARDAENPEFPGQNAVLCRRGIRGLRLLEVDPRCGPSLPDACGEQRHADSKTRLLPRVSRHRVLLAE